MFDELRARNVALCFADSEKMSTPMEVTADYAYFRLRDEGYQQADIERWAATIAALPGVTEAFVYFKHEEQGLGPEFAKRFIGALAAGAGAGGGDTGVRSAQVAGRDPQVRWRARSALKITVLAARD